MNTEFAERLGEIMNEKNFTAEDIAKIADVDLSHVYRYLRGEALPSGEVAAVLADAFACSLDYLFGLSDDYGSSLGKCRPFGECFRKLLSERGITRYRFIKDNRFAKQSVEDWYKGRYVPSVRNLEDIAAYFDCSLDALFGREN